MMNQTIVFSAIADFAAGTAEHLHPDDTIGRGALVLDEGAAEGSFTSPPLPVTPFCSLIASWNTEVPESCESEVFCRVQAQDGRWSDWLSWGIWSPYLKRHSIEADGGIASCSCDTLTLKHGLLGQAVQAKCVLRRSKPTPLPPALRLLAVSVKRDLADREGNTMEQTFVDHPIPAYSQLIRDPNMAHIMCSPTTATAQMNGLGGDLLPEETALACWDHVYEGYGNWAFTMAAAGSFGYETWLTYADIDTMRQELMRGYPVGCNVGYSNTPERANEDAPFVENTPGYTDGHLMCVRGMQVIDGREYVLVNDSYGSPDSQAQRRYPLDQFLLAWHGVLYIVRPKLAGAGYAAPHRIPAALKKTDFADEWRLTVGEEELPLDPQFRGSHALCTGVIAYSLLDGFQYATTANRPFRYGTVTPNGNLFLPAETLLTASPLRENARLDVFIITHRGITYTASLTPADL